MLDWLVFSQKKRKTETQTGLLNKFFLAYLFVFVFVAFVVSIPKTVVQFLINKLKDSKLFRFCFSFDELFFI